MTSPVLTKELTGAQIFMECLREQNIDTVFGYPGAIILSIYEEFHKCSDVKHYLVRHEQAAIHAAEGYARVSGKCGVALVTSGPGATNAVTGIANAYLDGYPLIVFTGQVPTGLLEKDAFQEVNIIDITKSCTKWNYQVKDVKELADVINKAFNIATSGRKGPVVIDLPKDVLESKTNNINVQAIINSISNPELSIDVVNKTLNLLRNAKKPVIISGGGVLTSGSSTELTALAQKFNIPVTTTLMGIGTYNIKDETNLGMLGVLGNYWANQAVSDCDVLLALGTRLNDRIVNSIKNCANNNAQIIYVDLEPSSFSKDLVQTPIVADIKYFLQELLKNIDVFETEPKTDWLQKINSWKTKKVLPRVSSEKMHPYAILEKIYEYTKDYNPIIVTEVGQHQMWAAQAFKFNTPGKFLTSGGLGTMGFGLPAAMGACLADRNSLVLDISGDGSLQMNIQELMTCVEYNLPVKVIIINNGYLGMVRQWQEKLYDKHYCGTQISSPDFVKVAQAYGAMGIRIAKEEDIIPALKAAIAHNGPVFLDFITESFDFVYPWLADNQ